ncbi:MAG: hypothetical protein AB7O24_17535 [Kofleriaceae bacterium]
MIAVDASEAQVLREILSSTLTQLRIESARTDAHAVRADLHERERIVEALLAKVRLEVKGPDDLS